MKKAVFWLLPVAALAGLIGYRLMEEEQAEEGNRKRGIAAVAVEAVRPEIAAIQDRRVFTGPLKPWSLYEVAPKVGGRLEEIRFDIGDRIRGGELIARIDPTEYQQVVDQNAADLDVARAQLAEAQVMLDLRKSELDRQKNLFEKNVGTLAQLESAQTNFQAQEAATRRNLAEVKRREAILDNAKLKLADCVITAEWCGDAQPRFVGERYVDQWTLLASNQAILSVAELDRLRAVIHVIERDYPYLRHEQTALLTTDAYPGRTFRGRIVRIAQLLQDNTRQAAVQLEIPNEDLRLKPGMFVRVELEFASKSEAVVVPRNAIVKRDGKEGVFTLDVENARAVFTPVEIGIAAGERVEILSPKLERPVITLGNHLLTHNVPVIVPAEFRNTAAEEAQPEEGSTP